ncbi:N-acetyldiaminopimelate deacetylase [Aquibacillus koreensis]|uniref:N-acetyldiaminopimelate deacetylase n=2 Tax=Aquibacillus koreensis TaxID=279446 RepID=A0A9X3WNV4_9BACI|nr:N-acetyldiaminopimelate deacetylase [Aquibacillus koreensis]MCT2538126.1 N-acetyldiaminopimelate deacetylase [Aquibacillus koreensis]MDC3420649.1 N-acetyldiaminopimelate deacetylase [Aquibacillus koreensis]
MNVKEVRRDLHQIPELGFKEYKTQQYLLNIIETFPQTYLSVKTWKTGILVRVTGKNPQKTIGFRADIDGLPITEETGYPFQSSHEGKMHACGHDFHMTIALGALERLAHDPIDDHALFVFQPAEEGPGGALPLMQSQEFNAWRPDIIFALHIAPELPVGTVSTRGGLLFANTSELFIDFAGKGGHAAYPHLTKDMVVAASAFISQLQQIVSRRIDPLESAVVTIGKMEGGFVQNVIAEHARLEGTIRTLEPNTIDIVKKNIEKFAKGFEISYDCSISIDYGSNYYQVFNTEAIVDQFKEVVISQGLIWKEAKPAMTGEDFGYFLKDIPGFMFWLGVDSAHGLHHSKLQPNEDALQIGVKSVETTIRQLS